MEQLLEAFHNLAKGDQRITESDMKEAHLSPEITLFLKQAMSSDENQGSDGYDCELFMCKCCYRWYSTGKLRGPCVLAC